MNKFAINNLILKLTTAKAMLHQTYQIEAIMDKSDKHRSWYESKFKVVKKIFKDIYEPI